MWLLHQGIYQIIIFYNLFIENKWFCPSLSTSELRIKPLYNKKRVLWSNMKKIASNFKNSKNTFCAFWNHLYRKPLVIKIKAKAKEDYIVQLAIYVYYEETIPHENTPKLSSNENLIRGLLLVIKCEAFGHIYIYIL